MTKENLIKIVFVVDESGSMEKIASDAIGGFNNLLKEQQSGEGEVRVTLALFNHHLNTVVVNAPIHDIAPLTKQTYRPSGSTALLDAVGMTILNVGDRLSHTPEDERPSLVMFVIITDGEENSSHLFPRSRIFEMITHQEEKYGWNFMYLGANVDSFAEAGSIGISHRATANYSATGQGMSAAYAATSLYILETRNAGGVDDVVPLAKIMEEKESEQAKDNEGSASV